MRSGRSRNSSIDLVVVNFYPSRRFGRRKLTPDEMIEFIDIGAHPWSAPPPEPPLVTIITDPTDYPGFPAKDEEEAKGSKEDGPEGLLDHGVLDS